MKNILKTLCLFILVLGVLSCERTAKKEKEVTHEKIMGKSRLVDSANLLTIEQEQNLLHLIQNIESKLGSQIAVIIVDTLNGVKIEQFSIQRAQEINLGRDNYNDGLLIAIAYKDHKMRIEVGFGLEKIITNEIAAQILKEKMAPKFKEQKYYDGIYASILRIKSLLEQNKDLIGHRL